MSTPNHYATDLTNEHWAIIEPLLPKQNWYPGGPGRPPDDLRHLINAIFYVNKTGCQWDMLPRDFGPWNTTLWLFLALTSRGAGSRRMEQLRHAEIQ